jgi:DNA-binding SARP family transcriptional activator/tetratricopeptide (TPR) repeat protein
MALRLRVLGTPLLERDGRPLDVGTEAIGLLAYLAVSGQVHAPGELAAHCWPGRQDAHAALKRTIAAVADTAGAIVRVDGGGVALDGGAISVDHRLVRELRERIAGHGHPQTAVCRDCVAPLTAIARLHRGPFLDGFRMPDNAVYDRWQAATADELDAALGVVLARLSDAHVLGGDLASAVDVTRRLVALDPLREAAHRQLLRLYAWQERPREALAQYRDCVRVLETQLGVSPLDETTRLSEDARAARVAPPSSAATWSGAEATARTSPAPPVTPRRTGPFLGREHELGMLADAMARVNSDGIVIVVEGEAGIGKTSLLRELAAHSTHGRRRVLTAACHAGEAMAPYGMLVKLLRSALRPDAGHDWLADLRPDTVRELGRLLPEVATVAGGAPPATGPGAVWRLVDALAEAVFAAASAPSSEWSPGVALVDDLQWSDQSSLQVLSHLAERLQGQPVGLVLAWRTELVGRGHQLRRLVSVLARRQLVRQLPLDRLDVDAVRMLSAELLGAGWDEVGDLAERIMEATEGVPQAVVDHIALVAAQDGAPWTGAAPDGGQVLRSTMMHLSPLEWQVLTAGAVIDRAFDAATVRRVSGRTHHEIRDALDGLVRAGLLSRSTELDAGYDVARADVREFVRAQAGPVRRRLLHGRAATALERQVQPGQVDPALTAAVASHHRAAGNDAAAAVWFCRAAEIASGMLAVAEATAHYEMALAFGPEQPSHVHEALGDLRLLEGHYSEALDRYEAAVATAVDLPPAALEHKIGGVYLRLGRWVLAEQHLEIALSALEQQAPGATALRARILTDRGLVAQRRGHDAEAVTAARAALRVAEEAADPGALAGAHNLLGVLSKQDLSTAREHLERALEHARALRDADIEIAAAGNLAQVHAAAGSLERALPLAESALARAGQMGDRHREAALRNTVADLLRGAGRNAEAMEHLKRAVALFAEIGEPHDQPPEAWKLAAW